MAHEMIIAEEIAFNPLEHAMGVKEVTWRNLEEPDLAKVHELEGKWLRNAGRATHSRKP